MNTPPVDHGSFNLSRWAIGHPSMARFLFGLILIAGLFDFLGVLQGALIDPAWNIGDQIRQTAYFFAGAVFFIICFGLSCYSASIERRLSKGERPRT